ncbi:MAG TPA: ATP-binding protein, partial [Burkholderiaceae bacterium]|nr:ATP-binding protein [Burkholderiaceae bacterium]
SHELRTPLHGILGLTRVVRARRHDDDELRHQLGLIEHSGEHLLQLINDLLDTSRIEAGRVEIDDVEFDLPAELAELIDIYCVRAQEKGLVFLTQIDLPVPYWVRGDPTRLRQILHNLLGNSLKFTDAGQVRLRARRTSDGAIEFVVEDSGQGIAPEHIAHVFDAFWQGGAKGKRAAGAGLGLNIALQMARAMGGAIHCESEIGRGSRFTVRLPMPEAPPNASRSANESEWMAGDIAPLQRRVLLAEDNEVNALVVQAMLSRNGWDVTQVDNGDDAVRLATEAQPRPDLVLMDCQMPVLDGIEATRRIRAHERHHGLAHLPVIALTANTAMDDREECRRAGMDLFLGKPFTERELMAVVSGCLPAITHSA